VAAARNKAELARLAIEVRQQDLGLTEYQRLCPYQLAEEHGITVYSLADLAAAGCSAEAIELFASLKPEVWSAALVPNGTGQFIVENVAHNRLRRRSNVAHEMAHLILEHEFDEILFAGDERGCKDPVSKRVEAEATELSGELLLPAAAARRAAIRRLSDQDVADLFDISVDFARWRMNVSGARLIAQRSAQKRAQVRR
jgi:Zn-dependent peptidase ImmA (M78 family)